ncbi:hypothetical protein ElyMa_005243300 [Elysia marginata]|uniref:Uncharacterized protein n=1 Tax=Elysia marginata TaxID=1093978 RepID=A0AAV4JYU5_9GAST|nr:hypothetical protein ElyMa_005243300 [Elysia marginata]
MSRVTSESTRTYTVQDASGTKTITERTVTTADGKTTTYKEEKTTSGGSGGASLMDRDAMMSKFNSMGGRSPMMQVRRLERPCLQNNYSIVEQRGSVVRASEL